MKSRPMLYQGAMVRAILDDIKTQTRRILKGSTEFKGPYNEAYLDMHKADAGWQKICPYGQVGDRLWVRETWCREFEGGFNYRADDAPGEKANFVNAEGEPVKGSRWKPSIHMPRAASRIELEITGIRIERLNDISEADAIAEGWKRRPEVSADPQVHYEAARDWYMDLWERINGAGTWAANPYVWVIEFKKVKP